MSHRRIRLESSFRIPKQTLGNEVYEFLVVALEDLSQSLGARSTSLSFRIDDWSRSASGIEKELSTGTAFDEILVWNSKDFHNASELFLLVLSWEERGSSVEFGDDTSQTPGVDGCVTRRKTEKE